jgi:hypothetical protein
MGTARRPHRSHRRWGLPKGGRYGPRTPSPCRHNEDMPWSDQAQWQRQLPLMVKRIVSIEEFDQVCRRFRQLHIAALAQLGGDVG